MYCNYCGKEIKNSAKYCPYCGKETHKGVPVEGPIEERDIDAVNITENNRDVNLKIKDNNRKNIIIMSLIAIIGIVVLLVGINALRRNSVPYTSQANSSENTISNAENVQNDQNGSFSNQISGSNENDSVVHRLVLTEVRIRKQASTNSDIIGHVYMGDIIPVLELRSSGQYTWYKIGTNAWIADDGNWTVDVSHNMYHDDTISINGVCGKYQYSDKQINFQLYLSEKGYFIYDDLITEETESGYYDVNGNEIILHYLYRINKKNILSVLNVQETLILKDNSIADNHPNKEGYTEISLSKVSSYTGFYDYSNLSSYRK